jgi:hypothetical protein
MQMRFKRIELGKGSLREIRIVNEGKPMGLGLRLRSHWHSTQYFWSSAESNRSSIEAREVLRPE